MLGESPSCIRHLTTTKSVLSLFIFGCVGVYTIINRVHQNDGTKHFARLFWQPETRKCGSADGTDQRTVYAIRRIIHSSYNIYKHARARRGLDCIIIIPSDGKVVQLTVAAATKFV